MSFLRTRRWRFAGTELRSSVAQGFLKCPYERMRAAKHTTPGPRRLLERRHGLAEIIERGVRVIVERHRIIYGLGPVPVVAEGGLVTCSSYAARTHRKVP